MKAIRVHAFGGPENLKYEDAPDPKPGPGQILVRLRAAGVNPVETYIRSGIYGPKEFPYTPGTDAAGTIESVGLGVAALVGERVFVTGSLTVATAILIESALSFLGLGDPNTMTWGFMIGAGRTFLRTAWWLCTIPGLAILVTVLAINLAGEGLNDTLNPRLRGRS